jgi:single-stranded-DNA-specific exonuclease
MRDGGKPEADRSAGLRRRAAAHDPHRGELSAPAQAAVPLGSGSSASDSSRCILDVERSLKGRAWRLRAASDREVAALAQRFALPEPLARVLVARGVAAGDVGAFLEPRVGTSLPEPYGLRDMEAGARRLADAVTGGQSVVVFADYDVDGATSSAVLRRFLAAAGLPVGVYVPDRLAEGYGPSANAMTGLREQGADLVVTVDCGINAHAALEAARAVGLDVIVVDHHRAEPVLPPAAAVINPNRLDDDSGCGALAAVGVAFLLAVATNRLLRAAGWYASRPEPDLLRLLDLVALGTVCDMAPLVGLNRAFVVQGLKMMARRQTPGLSALADVAGLRAPPRAHDLGFALGPRINAGGRVGCAWYGAALLAEDDAHEAARLAGELDRYNRDRQRIEREVFDQALVAIFADHEDASLPMVWAAGEDWHPGVLGIVASRLVERIGRPAFVLSLDNEGATGSARSVPGIDLGALVAAAAQAGLLRKAGGHAMAAGFALPRDVVPAFRRFLATRLGEPFAAAAKRSWLDLDGLLAAAGASTELSAALAAAEPFGIANPEPRFAFAGLRVIEAAVVGERHVRCSLSDGSGRALRAIAFRSADTALGQAILEHGGRPLHLAGRLSQARPFNGGTANGAAEVVIDDAAWCGAAGEPTGSM